MASTFGAATTSNPRPFKCTDCQKSFRIHGHLAKHLRSKMHIMKLECLGKLPFGTYAEMERSGINLNDIDTTDCDNSLTSLQVCATITIIFVLFAFSSYKNFLHTIELQKFHTHEYLIFRPSSNPPTGMDSSKCNSR